MRIESPFFDRKYILLDDLFIKKKVVWYENQLSILMSIVSVRLVDKRFTDTNSQLFIWLKINKKKDINIFIRIAS